MCTLKRDELFCVQTPQGFRTDVIREAYRRAYAEGFYGTDDASLAERAGYSIAVAEGSYANIKITTKEDLPVETRIGSGYDVHRLEAGRKLILCGTEIPFEKGLLGHSDADVALHALMDAMLGGRGRRRYRQTFSGYGRPVQRHIEHGTAETDADGNKQRGIRSRQC